MKRMRFVLCLVALVALVACGGSSKKNSSATATTMADVMPKCTPSGAALTITAKSVKFDKDCLAAPANQPSTIEFDNQDASIPHNLSIYTDKSATKELFKGDEFVGVNKKTYNVPPLAPGSYHFHCDIHPTTMEGTFVVQ
jgi:plastocyanin